MQTIKAFHLWWTVKHVSQEVQVRRKNCSLEE